MAKYKKHVEYTKEGGLDFEKFYKNRGTLDKRKKRIIDDGIYEYVVEKDDRTKKLKQLQKSIDEIFNTN